MLETDQQRLADKIDLAAVPLRGCLAEAWYLVRGYATSTIDRNCAANARYGSWSRTPAIRLIIFDVIARPELTQLHLNLRAHRRLLIGEG